MGSGWSVGEYIFSCTPDVVLIVNIPCCAGDMGVSALVGGLFALPRSPMGEKVDVPLS